MSVPRVLESSTVPKERAHFDDPESLTKEIGQILVEGPLYSRFIYTGTTCHNIRRERMGAEMRYGLIPKEVRMYCDNQKCKALQWWKAYSHEVPFGGTFIREKVYTCNNCGVSKQYYLIIWQERADFNIFLKVGQYPALSIEPSPEIEKAFSKEDADLYKKGLIEFQFGHGIGCVSYFRRVLENKINDLLDLIAATLRNEGGTGRKVEKTIKQIEAVKKSRRVAARIKFASKVLPARLKPGGQNPFDKLYDLLSAGLHGETDEQCLKVLADAKFRFEYLFKNLGGDNAEYTRYVKEMSEPTKALEQSSAPATPAEKS